MSLNLENTINKSTGGPQSDTVTETDESPQAFDLTLQSPVTDSPISEEVHSPVEVRPVSEELQAPVEVRDVLGP